MYSVSRLTETLATNPHLVHSEDRMYRRQNFLVCICHSLSVFARIIGSPQVWGNFDKMICVCNNNFNVRQFHLQIKTYLIRQSSVHEYQPRRCLVASTLLEHGCTAVHNFVPAISNLNCQLIVLSIFDEFGKLTSWFRFPEVCVVSFRSPVFEVLMCWFYSAYNCYGLLRQVSGFITVSVSA